MSVESSECQPGKCEKCSGKKCVEKIRKFLPNVWKKIRNPNSEVGMSVLDLLTELADYFENPNPMKAAKIFAKFALLLKKMKEWPAEDTESSKSC